MSLDTYANLKTELASWLDRTDLTSQIDTFIDLCEAKLSREVRVRAMLKRATATLTTSTKYLALPTGYKAMKILRLLTNPPTVLRQVNETELTARLAAETGQPLYFSIHEEIEFDRVPDDEYSVELIYYCALTALSDSNTSNWILANAPDLYLYGSLIAAEPFLDNDERIATWKTFYKEGVDALNLEDMRSRTSGPQISKPMGPTP